MITVRDITAIRGEVIEHLELIKSSFSSLFPNTHILCHLVSFLRYPLICDMFIECLRLVRRMGASRTRIQTLPSKIAEVKDKQENYHKT